MNKHHQLKRNLSPHLIKSFFISSLLLYSPLSFHFLAMRSESFKEVKVLKTLITGKLVEYLVYLWSGFGAIFILGFQRKLIDGRIQIAFA